MGHRFTPTWYSWRAMIRRCHDPKNCEFVRYGARGISVCKRWRSSYLLFLRDMGERPESMTLDRRDPNANYKKSNCRWADNKTQCRNRRTNRHIEHDGRKLTIAEWSEITGLKPNTIRKRLTLGWTSEAILWTPLKESPRERSQHAGTAAEEH